MTAENLHRLPPLSLRRARFNEAAADDRGKPLALRRPAGGAHRASMRPRPMTAENPALRVG